MAADNRTIGRFHLTGLPPAPRGVPQIEASSGISKDEIDKMMKDAEAHAAEDKQRRELVDLRNTADQLVYQTEKELQEHGDKAKPETRKKVEGAVERLKEASKRDNLADLKAAIEALNAVRSQLGAEVYEAASAQGTGSPGGGAGSPGGGSGAAGGSKGDEGPVEADYEVVD
jgi:molecular chaperone DnaK